jgi:FkbM family methyltransferase
MKEALGWVWPDHEEHLLHWMREASPPIINGRAAYQGKKQLAAISACKQHRTAIDVGAHIGLWSYNLSRSFRNVEAFEPVANHRECFIANVMAPNVILHGYALGALPGRVSINVAPGSSGDSTVQPGDDVEMRRLDEFNIQEVDLIKVDCEGFEENVLVGACETIIKWHPTIIVEQKRDMASRFGLQPLGAVRMLKNMGYVLAKEIGGDYIMVYP